MSLRFYTFILLAGYACIPAYGQAAGQVSIANAAPEPSVKAPKGFVIFELRIPMESAGPRGLQALLVRPDEPGRHPLAIITHGTNSSEKVRRARSPQFQLPVAMEFARRGWTAVIVLRRGNGDSGGRFQEEPGVCERARYETIGKAASDDLRAAIDFLAKLPEVDPKRIIALGVSGGGFATVALTVNPPPGLVAGINFAGGSWPWRNRPACMDNLVAAFRSFGTKSRVPMLWVYSENDMVFWPEIVQRFYAAFTDGGGTARFIHAPPFEDNGHNLLGARGIPLWTAYVDDFLKSQNLQLRTVLLPAPPPAPRRPLQPPPELDASWASYFQEYLAAHMEKAFAVSANGTANYAFGFQATTDASKSALELCESHGEKCRIAFINNSPVR